MSRDRDTVTAVTSVQAGKGPARDTILLDKYRVEATLGFGGMGLVIRAHNLQTDDRVAIKFLREDVQLEAEHVERFLREAKAAVRLKSEHVAKIRDVGTLEDGRPYMVMELLEGMDLGKLLLDHGAIDPRRAVDLILQACDAIAEAHALGIVHRDIKPTNLFITRRRDDSELLKVLDFGISKAQSGPEISLTQTSSMLGTPAYMSPEQMRSARTVDPRSDIWALGTVLYELAEGRLPFDATNFAELCVMVSTEPYAPMTKAPHLAHVMARCLAKSVDERFQDVGELAAELEPYASEPGAASRQVARIQRVLGKGPASRDSTPIPTSRGIGPPTRDSIQRIGTRDSIQRIVGVTPAPGPRMPELKTEGGGLWKSIVLLLVLFGIGIGAGLYVTSRNDAEQPSTAATREDASAGSAVAAEDAAVEALATDAGVAETADAGSSAGSSAAGSGADDGGSGGDSGDSGSATPTQVPPKKQPPRKHPPKKPPAIPAGSGGGATTPTGSGTTGTGAGGGSGKKPCDAFANPRGCH